MTMLAVPIMVLITIVMLIAWLNDRRKGRTAAANELADDQISPLDDVTPID